MLFSRFRSSGWLVVLLAVILVPLRAFAIGWGPTDFLITGAPNFPQYIGVFDSSFNFKGYLDNNFLGVQGMDFDAAGDLVAVSSLGTNPEVRVYSPSGSRIGGFFTNNSMLQYTGDLKVAPNGNYAFGTNASGVQVYSPQGTLVTQYGSGNSQAITYLPGNRLWAGGTGSTVHVFDTTSGLETSTFLASGQTMSYSMRYSDATNSVLVVDEDRDAGGIYERDPTGALLNVYHIPTAQTHCYSATRGPSNYVFGTSGNKDQDVVKWAPDGTVSGTFEAYPYTIGAGSIIWAGLAPEPSSLGVFLVGILSQHCLCRRQRSLH